MMNRRQQAYNTQSPWDPQRQRQQPVRQPLRPVSQQPLRQQPLRQQPIRQPLRQQPVIAPQLRRDDDMIEIAINNLEQPGLFIGRILGVFETPEEARDAARVLMDYWGGPFSPYWQTVVVPGDDFMPPTRTYLIYKQYPDDHVYPLDRRELKAQGWLP